jgi:hypothetical protein
LGASSTKVRDGDIDAWSWTGRDANIPALTMEDVVTSVGVVIANGEAGAIPTPAVKTVFPSGFVGASGSEDGQDLLTYLAGVGAVLVVAGTALVAIRRRRRVDNAA